jgi:hypothetical protein
MSEDNENLVDEVINNAEESIIDSGPSQESQDDAVSYSTHKKLLGQFKSNQKAARDLAAKVAQLEAEREDSEKTKLEQKEEYKQLYENATNKLKQMEVESLEKEKALVDEHKRRALEKELGGLRKAEYFKFADLSNIVIGDDGLVDDNSVKFEANRYRQEFPELLTATKKLSINNQAPSNDGIIRPNKSAKEMNRDDRSASKRNLISKKK